MADKSDLISFEELGYKSREIKNNPVDNKNDTGAKIIDQSTEKSLETHLALKDQDLLKSIKYKKRDLPYEDFTEIIVRQLELDHETGVALGWYKGACETSPVHVRTIYEGIEKIKREQKSTSRK
jgi:hypothetical protein